MIETLANGYSSDSAQQELSHEYQHDRVKMILIIFCFFVHWTKVTSASEGLITLLNHVYQMIFPCVPEKDCCCEAERCNRISSGSDNFIHCQKLVETIICHMRRISFHLEIRIILNFGYRYIRGKRISRLSLMV